MSRVLARALHYPKPEHREDLIAAMKRLAAAVADVPFDEWDSQPSSMAFMPQVT